jgi:hypothetical protein
LKEEADLLGDLSDMVDKMKSLSCDRSSSIAQLAQAHYDEIQQLKRTHAYQMSRMSSEYGKMLRDCTNEHAVTFLNFDL